MSATWPLVGRAGQRDELTAAVRAGRSAMVIGAPGIGKTRLVAEVANIVAVEHFRVVRVVGTRAAATMAFGAFAALVEPGSARVDAAARLHHILVAMAPICLVVDDANLLDPASASVVHRVALDGVSVLATMRSGETPPDAITQLWRDDNGTLIELRPLGRDDVRSALEAVLDGHVDGRVAYLLTERSGGNPLLLQELVGAALNAGSLRQRGGMWKITGPLPVGDRLAELLPLRLDRMPAGVRRLTELLSLADALDVTVLEAMGVGADVDAAEDERLVTVSAEGTRQVVRLRHPLFADVIADRLPARRRARHLTDLAASVSTVDDDLGRVRATLWRLDAGVLIPADDLLTASRLARGVGASSAVRLARAAVERGGGVPATLELADLLTHDQRADEAEALLASLDPATLDPMTAMMVAANRALALALGAQRPEDALTVLAEAVGDGPEPPPLAAMRAIALMRSGENLAAGVLAEGLATDVELPPPVRMAGLLTGVATAAYGGRAAHGLAMGRAGEALIPASATAMPEAAASLRLLNGLCARLLGDLGTERVAAERGYADALARDHDGDREQYAMVLGQLETLAGRPRAGERLLREAYVGGGIWWHANLHWIFAQFAETLAVGGETVQARRVWAEARAVRSCRLWEPTMLAAAVSIGKRWLPRMPGSGTATRARPMTWWPPPRRWMALTRSR